MGKIFDALEKSSKVKKSNLPVPGINKKMALKTNLQKKITKAVNPKKKGFPNEPERVVRLNKRFTEFKDDEINGNLVTYHQPQSIEADIFKLLRTSILFPETGSPPRTILVSSALPGDGKSFVSSNLAVSIAGGIEESVLLIDCDIRKPSVHKAFGFEQSIGLSEYLTGKVDLSKVIQKSFLKKLSLIPGGHPPINPTELLSSKKMKDLLNEVKNRYDDRYIIIDSPPPAMAPETHVIEKYVDGIIVVIKAGKTPRKAVAEIVNQFSKDKMLGFVLNQAEENVKSYYGHAKSYYSERIK